ncbi:hypothetical protein HYPSUDRAFT_86167 [Hypholoma sublateritium FD-334 SS-4]|uniref:Uncharacterized protein n=1 Tax=Hypholoma sublateritium (strain FD-334 SS-4) TaxID=945553 RepID=A0A0D2LAI1_HYPSF|nr:hypothetical protein HYPSUDRAFT_86167 [Hypholoma sublateritium FD-334 SS-4]
MRFSSFAVFVALQTLVSALPLYSGSSHISQRDIGQIEARAAPDYWPELVTRTNNAQWELSLRKHNFPEFHWGLYLHPVGATSGGTVCEAKSSRAHVPGVSHLLTTCFADTHDNSPVTLTPLGHVGTAAKKDQAVHLLSGVACQTPTENCVDYTLKGATLLHTHRLIDDAALAKMKTEFDENEAEIRKATAPHFTVVHHPKP